MKKLFICFAIAIVGLASLNAQSIRFGAKAGVNFASLGGDVEDADGRTSFHIGALAEFVISEKFSFQSELLYSGLGATYEESESFEGMNFSYEEKIKLDYLSVPLMAKYYVTDNFSLEGGPIVSFLLSANGEYEGSFDGQTESEEEDISDFFKTLDFGLGFGAAYRLSNGLGFSARYTLGLSDISEEPDGTGDFFEEDVSINNNVIQVSVLYFFN